MFTAFVTFPGRAANVMTAKRIHFETGELPLPMPKLALECASF